MLLTSALLISALSISSSLLPVAAPEPGPIALGLHFPTQNLVVPDPQAIVSALCEQSLAELAVIAAALPPDATVDE